MTGHAIARKAIGRKPGARDLRSIMENILLKIGARDLRSIMESILLKIMFDVPSLEGRKVGRLKTILVTGGAGCWDAGLAGT
jgi:ATP-dependent protease Clp ATPase subunit